MVGDILSVTKDPIVLRAKQRLRPSFYFPVMRSSGSRSWRSSSALTVLRSS